MQNGRYTRIQPEYSAPKLLIYKQLWRTATGRFLWVCCS
jgi:hypothetical protein